MSFVNGLSLDLRSRVRDFEFEGFSKTHARRFEHKGRTAARREFVSGRNFQVENIGRVIVRGANWVGDAVMTVPALRELRRVLPQARITLATRAWAADLFAGADFLDELFVLDGGKRGALSFLSEARELRARRFDLALLFPNAFAPALTAFAARIPERVGYATDGRGPLLTRRLQVPAWRGGRHEVYHYLNLVAELERLLLGTTTVEAREPRTELTISEERKAGARAMLAERGVTFENPIVALCPGSTNSRAKRWPAERFAALADMLATEAKADVLLIGARAERDVSREVASKMRCAPLILTGETELSLTAGILSVVDLLVTNDTGPAHVADAVGCPTLVIFGPTDPVATRPFSDRAEVIRRPPDCAPCMLRDCPIDHRCMTAIDPRDVFARALSVVATRKRAEVAR